MAVVVVVCGYVHQQGQELRKVNPLVLILVLFLKDIGQVLSAPFLLWEEDTKIGKFSSTKAMSWEKRKKEGLHGRQGMRGSNVTFINWRPGVPKHKRLSVPDDALAQQFS